MCYVLVFCSVGHVHCVLNQAFICPGLLWCCAVPNAPPLVQTSNMFSQLRMKHSCLVFHPSEWNLLPTSLALCFSRPRSFFFHITRKSPPSNSLVSSLSLSVSRPQQPHGCVPRDGHLDLFEVVGIYLSCLGCNIVCWQAARRWPWRSVHLAGWDLGTGFGLRCGALVRRKCWIGDAARSPD